MIKFRVIKLKSIIIILLTVLVTFSFCVYGIVRAKEDITIELPIIMYHSVLKSASGDYIVSPKLLENDFKYIKEKGYTTIIMQDLIDYVYDGKELPEKPIIITFDDGHYNNLGYVEPLLEKYDMKAVISIVGKYTDTSTQTDEENMNYGFLRWKDINEMMKRGRVEFQNHTYDFHKNNAKRKGCMKKKNETLEEYEEVFSKDILKLQEEFKQNTNYTPNTFTYPYGMISKESIEIVKKLGFKASLSCNEGVNKITKNPDCLYQLKRNNRPSYVKSVNFFSKLLK